jgi:phage terminase large subunit-like protein
MSLMDEWKHLILERDPAAWIDHFIKKSELNRDFHLYRHQREILAAAFDFNADGKLPWDIIVWSCTKKSGKTTMLGLLCLWWAMTQEASNEIILLANDLEQTQARAFASIVKLLRYNPIDPGASISSKEIKLSNDSVIKAIASEYAGAAGSNHGCVGLDELWAYTSERSRRLYDELTGVPTRVNSIKIITTYAGFEAESQLLRDLYVQGVGTEEHPDGQGERIHPTLPVYVNREARIFCYWDHEPRFPWQSAQYYAAQKRTLRASAYLRFHENRWSTSEEAFITPELWDPCVDPMHRPLLPTRDVRLFIGVDGSIKHDSAAIVAVRWDGDHLALALHRIWQPTPEEPLDLEATIEAELKSLHQRYQLAKIAYDPYQLHRSMTGLRNEGLRTEEYPQTSGNLTRAGQSLFDLLSGKNLRLYPSEDLRTQALNTISVESTRGWRIAKERASRKVDAIVALSLACVSALDEGPVMAYQVPPGEMPAIWASAAEEGYRDETRIPGTPAELEEYWNREST